MSANFFSLVAPSFAIDIHDVVLTRPHDQPERRLP